MCEKEEHILPEHNTLVLYFASYIGSFLGQHKMIKAIHNVKKGIHFIKRALAPVQNIQPGQGRLK